MPNRKKIIVTITLVCVGFSNVASADLGTLESAPVISRACPDEMKNASPAIPGTSLSVYTPGPLLADQKTILETLHFENRIFLTGLPFEAAFRNALTESNLTPETAGDLSKLSDQGKKTFALAVWKTFAASMSNAVDSRAHVGTELQIQKSRDQAANNFGLANSQELGQIATLVKEIDESPQKREAAVQLIINNMAGYSKALKSNVLATQKKALISYIGKTSRDIKANIASSVGIGVPALVFTHNFYLMGIGFTVPWLVRGMIGLKDYITYRKYARDWKNFAPELGLSLGKNPDPKMLNWSKPAKELVESTVSLEDLKQMKPEIDLRSIGSMEDFGAELEHGVSILSDDVSRLSIVHRDNPSVKKLVEGLNKLLGKKTLGRSNNVTYADLNSLGNSIFEYKKQIRAEFEEAQIISAAIDAVDQLFINYIAYLNKTKQNYINERKEERSKDVISQTLEDKASELEGFRTTIDKMRSLVTSNLEPLSLMRRNLTSLVNDTADQVAANGSSVVSPDRLKLLTQLRDSLSQ
jgi:hypothetical protein